MSTLYDIEIKSLDLDFIQKLASIFDLDYKEIEIEDLNNITNDIIYGLYTQYIDSLDVKEHLKDELKENIYCNYLDSGIDLDIEVFIIKNKLEEQRSIIENLI